MYSTQCHELAQLKTRRYTISSSRHHNDIIKETIMSTQGNAVIYRYGSLNPKDDIAFYQDGSTGAYMRRLSEKMDVIKPARYPSRCGSLYGSPSHDGVLVWKNTLEYYADKKYDYLYKIIVNDSLRIFNVAHFDKALYEFDGNAEKYWNTSMTLKQYMSKRKSLNDITEQRDMDSFWEILFSPDDVLSVEKIAIN